MTAAGRSGACRFSELLVANIAKELPGAACGCLWLGALLQLAAVLLEGGVNGALCGSSISELHMRRRNYSSTLRGYIKL